jgi:hypothetical protein
MPGQAAIAQQRDKLPHLATGKISLHQTHPYVPATKSSFWQGYFIYCSFTWHREKPKKLLVHRHFLF